MSIKEHPPHHIPVLLDSVVDLLKPQPGESYLDLTAGYGGHARAILEKTGNAIRSVLVDRDDYAIGYLSSLEAGNVKDAQLLHTDFLSAASQLVEEGRRFDMLLVDLGVSSPQLDQSERGFSFKNSGPLDMRMDRRQVRSAETFVNKASVQELAHIIHEYGEEPLTQARAIASAIVYARPLHETAHLAAVVASAYRGHKGKIHPATRTFQALRIAVNDELRQVEKLLPLVPRLLTPGGRVAIISFHSLEDRLVKRFFKEQRDAGFEAQLQELTKKPLAGDLYDVHNPRSRSAKLRAAVKI